MTTTAQDRQFSVPLIRRLPEYYAIIEMFLKQGKVSISSTTIAEYINLDPIIVRKDLESIGAVGKPKVGFQAAKLLEEISMFMGWNTLDELVIAGCGDLGTALMGYMGFAKRGFKIIAGFDVDPLKQGTVIHGIQIFPVAEMANLIRRLHVQIGIIAVPVAAAQDIALQMVAGGVTGIWNFAPTALNLPSGISVQQEDIITSLVILQKNMHQSRKRLLETGGAIESDQQPIPLNRSEP
jgi:redox-sensing transcriptional repressor